MPIGFAFDTGTIPHSHFLYEKNINKHEQNIQTICAKIIVISDDVEQIRIYYICMYIMKHHIYYHKQQIIKKEAGWHKDSSSSGDDSTNTIFICNSIGDKCNYISKEFTYSFEIIQCKIVHVHTSPTKWMMKTTENLSLGSGFHVN